MDLDLNDIIDFLHAAARSVGAEVTSPWFYLQLGLILAGAGIAFAAGAAIRARIDLTTLAIGWPAPLRLFVRVLVGSASTVVFAVLMRLARIVMLTVDLAEPQLSAGGRRQAGAGLAGHPAGDVGHPQRIHGPRWCRSRRGWWRR